MEIRFSSGAQRKLYTNERKLRRKFGTKRAKLIMRRLAELHAASCLEDLRQLPGPRLHQHVRGRGQLKAIFTVDLDHPKRLFFEVAHDPEPQPSGGGVDWKQVTSISIIGVDDPHG